jgi:hypothetical protein
MRPFRITSSALGMPIRRGSRCTPPHAGKVPSFTSGNPICVLGWLLGTMRLQHSANSHAPPGAGPLMAATVNRRERASLAKIACVSRTMALAAAGSVSASRASTSAPARNWSRARPVSTNPRRSWSRAISSRAA